MLDIWEFKPVLRFWAFWGEEGEGCVVIYFIIFIYIYFLNFLLHEN